jgi:hypothetical protein
VYKRDAVLLHDESLMGSAYHHIAPILEITKHFSLGVMVSPAAMSKVISLFVNHTSVRLMHFQLLITLGRE